MVDPKGQAHSNQPEHEAKTDARRDAGNNVGRGAPADRQERIQRGARNEGRSLDRDPQYQNRKAHDLDREETELLREGVAGERPGVRLSKEEAERDKQC